MEANIARLKIMYIERWKIFDFGKSYTTKATFLYIGTS